MKLEKDGKIGSCNHAVDLAGWLKAGWKQVGKGGAKKPSAPSELNKMSKDSLIELAEKKGITVDTRWGIDKLIGLIKAK